MRIAISSTGESVMDPMDPRFGRTRYFILHDTTTGTNRKIDNEQNRNAQQGAGIQSAMNVAKAGADLVLTGHCGPKAFYVLQEAGIRIFLTDAKTVLNALEQYQAGKLRESVTADVEGHWI